MPPDYHSKPVLAVRVPGELQDWARSEAERREQGLGDFVRDLLAAERDRVNHVDDHECDHRVPAGAYCRTCGKIKEG